MIEGSNNFINGSTQGKLPCCQVWWPHALYYWRYNGFSLPHDPARRCDQRVMLLFGLQSIKVIYDPVNFGGNRHSGSGDITVLVCHVISQHYVIKAVIALVVSHHPAKFGDHKHCRSEDINPDRLKQIPTAQII